MDFDQELIERCGSSIKKHIGKYGFVLVLVKSREEPELMAATNLVPEMALQALSGSHAYLKQLDRDAKEMLDKMRLEGGIDAPRLGDGSN